MWIRLTFKRIGEERAVGTNDAAEHVKRGIGN